MIAASVRKTNANDNPKPTESDLKLEDGNDDVFEDADGKDTNRCCCCCMDKRKKKRPLSDVEKTVKRMALFNKLAEAERLVRVSG